MVCSILSLIFMQLAYIKLCNCPLDSPGSPPSYPLRTLLSFKLLAATLPFLVAVASAPVEDWKTLLGWDGKVFTVEQIGSDAHLVHKLLLVVAFELRVTSDRILALLTPAGCTSAPTPTTKATV